MRDFLPPTNALPVFAGYDVEPEVAARLLPRPPIGWKRPAIPNKVKLQVIINQGGKSAISGERLGRIEDVRFDHRPALVSRRYDPVADDTVPSANDERYIEAITKEEHDVRTFGTGGTTRGSDVGEAARSKRILKNRGRKKKKIPQPKNFKWPKRKLQGRGFQQRSA